MQTDKGFIYFQVCNEIVDWLGTFRHRYAKLWCRSVVNNMSKSWQRSPETDERTKHITRGVDNYMILSNQLNIFIDLTTISGRNLMLKGHWSSTWLRVNLPNHCQHSLWEETELPVKPYDFPLTNSFYVNLRSRTAMCIESMILNERRHQSPLPNPLFLQLEKCSWKHLIWFKNLVWNCVFINLVIFNLKATFIFTSFSLFFLFLIFWIWDHSCLRSSLFSELYEAYPAWEVINHCCLTIRGFYRITGFNKSRKIFAHLFFLDRFFVCWKRHFTKKTRKLISNQKIWVIQVTLKYVIFYVCVIVCWNTLSKIIGKTRFENTRFVSPC